MLASRIPARYKTEARPVVPDIPAAAPALSESTVLCQAEHGIVKSTGTEPTSV